MDLFWGAPPVTRTLTAATFLESVLVYGRLLGGYRVIFHHSFLFKFPPEVWRIFTSFLLTGSGLSFVFDLYFLYTYGSALEKGSPRFSVPGDFFTYIFFVGTVILITSGGFLGGVIFTSALILALAYTYAEDNRGKKVTFIIIQIPVEFLPWAMLALTLVFAGYPAAMQEGMGIIAAHLYDFLTRLYPTFQGGKNYIQSPAIVKRWFGAHQSAQSYRTYGTAFRPGQEPQSGSSSGWTSAFSGAWSGRGAGRRLGGG